MSKQIKTVRKPTHDEIAARAQRIYESEGRPQGRALQHWLQAEAELTVASKMEASASAPKPAALPAVAVKESGGNSWQSHPGRQTLQKN